MTIVSILFITTYVMTPFSLMEIGFFFAVSFLMIRKVFQYRKKFDELLGITILKGDSFKILHDFLDL